MRARLYLDDFTGLVLRDLEARAWWLKIQHPDLTLLVVDYLQLVTAMGAGLGEIWQVGGAGRFSA